MPVSTDAHLPRWDDMQGLVLSAYPHLDRAAYLLFTIHDRAATAAWLKGLVGGGHVTPALKYIGKKTRRNVNVAFTAAGLAVLSGGEDALEEFAVPFVEGIAGRAHRSRVLGDTGPSAPNCWNWGGPRQPQVHLLLMVFADDAPSLDSAILEVGPPSHAATRISAVFALPISIAREREHFGFVDGISQPILAGSDDAERFPESTHLTALGEIVCGYPNADGTVPRAPALRQCPAFGLNGSYLVFRQIEQHVAEFWNAVYARTQTTGHDDPVAAERLAAKIVGRRPDGTPLVAGANRDDNEFGFSDDPYGQACPIGAHIRRANPRDGFANNNMPAGPAVASNRRRMLRRGRSYGTKLGDPRADDGQERGLCFVCLNADIERQFEFVMQNWVNGSAFAGLRQERDPLIGDRAGATLDGAFTIPGPHGPACVSGLPRFVTVKGGGYFFLPGLRALQSLAELTP
jgi:Dyp-type peroxidase family